MGGRGKRGKVKKRGSGLTAKGWILLLKSKELHFI